MEAPTTDSRTLNFALLIKETLNPKSSSLAKEDLATNPTRESAASYLKISKDATSDLNLVILEGKSSKKTILKFTIPLKLIELEPVEKMLD